MSRKQFLFVIVVALFGGMVGAVMYNHLFNSFEAFAEIPKRPIIEAKEIRIINENGKVTGSFESTSEGAQLTMDHGEHSITITPKIIIINRLNHTTHETMSLYLSNLSFYRYVRDVPTPSTLPPIPVLDAPPIITLGLDDKDKAPALKFYDSKYHLRVALGPTRLVNAKGSTIIKPISSLVLFNENGSVIWSAP